VSFVYEYAPQGRKEGRRKGGKDRRVKKEGRKG